ncbi:MAG TPA: nucleotide sugar dehydrogenase, partial [Bacteroidales bacterium]|nr:nucleotide sugar dehydrogenase [Bacteroidales bacterium]
LKDPDVSFILSVLEELSNNIHKDMLIVLESTTYPGTTRELILPRLQESGLEVGKDFYLVFSPERVDPGNAQFHTKNTPKVMGGVTPQCTEIGKMLYEQVIDTIIPVSSPESAELVKLLENTFRSINIGLVNEMAIMAEKLGVDIWEVIDAADTKPFGFMKFYPGPGLGGHCIPIDPHYLAWKMKTLDYKARFIELAGEINTEMPIHVVQLVMEGLNHHKKSVNGANILVLGVAYKKNIDDVRESPALDIIRLLQNKGAGVDYYDPFINQVKLDGSMMQSVEYSDELFKRYDCVVIATDHTVFDFEKVVNDSALVIDTRNTIKNLDGKKPANVSKLGAGLV